MKMTGEQSIAATRARAWEALNDPEVLKQCIPGCQSLERDGENRFKAVVAIKVGPIGAKFNGAVTLSDIDAPNGYTLSGEGQGGPAGFAKGSAQVRLVEEGPQSTKLSYDVDAQVGGKIAQLGGAVIDATAKQLAGSFFKKLGQIVGEPAAPEAAVPAAAAAPQAAAAPAAPAAASAPPATPAAPSAATVAAAQAQQGQAAPMAWILALVVCALVAYFVGAGGGGDWTGVGIGLMVLVAAAAGFELGRRAAAPVVVLDPEQLRRLLANKSGGDA